MAQGHVDSDYLEKILKNYSELKGDLHLVELEREAGTSLGLSLVGNRDLTAMSVFVAGIQPDSIAAFSGLIHVGDELLEINGHILFGRSHLNASAIIKSISCVHIRILLIRSEDFTERMAVSPLQLPPVAYKDSSVTLIQKKPNSLSLDDVPAPDDPSRTCDVLQRQLAISESSQNSNNTDVNESVMRDNAATVKDSDKLCTNQKQKIDFPPSADDLTMSVDSISDPLEKGSIPTPVCQPPPPPSPPPASVVVQSKCRRLQKSAQVEELDEEMTTTTAAAAMASASDAEKKVAPEPRTGPGLHSPQLKSDAAKPIGRHRGDCIPDVPTVDVEMEWNHCRLEEISPETSTNSSSPLHPLGSTVPEDPSSCSIIPGRSNIIEIRKGKLGLGLKIIGGSDTILKAIIVYEVFKNGAAAKDSRLRPGDQLLEVNSLDMREMTHSRAVQVLRQVVSSVKMVVFRDESIYRDDELYEAVTVELMKKPGKGLGLSIVSRRDNTGILISDIVKGGVADTDGRLLPGDQILAVNGSDMRTATQDYAAELLKTSMGKMILQISRLKLTSKQNSSRNSASSSHSSCGMLKSESNASDCRHTGRRIPKSNGPCHQEG